MGCCQAGQALDDDAELQQEMAPIRDEVVVVKEAGKPLAVDVDPQTLKITGVGAHPELREHVGWIVAGVGVGFSSSGLGFAQENVYREMGSEGARQAARVRFLLTHPDVMEPSRRVQMTIAKPAPDALLGLMFRPQGMIVDKVFGPAAQAGMQHYLGWNVVQVEGRPVKTMEDFTTVTAGRTTFRLTLVEVPLLPSEKAVLKLRKGFTLFRERRKLEELMFRLILRDLEIQEECEMNVLDAGLDGGWDGYGKTLSGKAPHLTNSRSTHVPEQRLQDIANSILATGQHPHDLREVLGILLSATEQFKARKNVHRIEQPKSGALAVVGDLHGQLADVAYIFKNFGTPSPNNMYLFNGDYVDRGEHGVEVVLLLCCFALLYPGCVFLNRGNHEDAHINSKYGFGEECAVTKYNWAVFDAMQKLFKALPLMHTARKVAVCHGGLPGIMDLQLDEINRIDRQQNVPRTRPGLERWELIFQGLLWSDPKDDLGAPWAKSQRGAGVYFSQAVTESFLHTNQLAMLVRSHQTVDLGTKTHHQGRVHTVFSASSYRGKGKNRGAVIVLNWENGHFQGADSPTWSEEDKLGVAGKVGEGPAQALRSLLPKWDVLQRAGELIFRRQGEIQACLQQLDKSEEGRLTRAEFVGGLRQVLPHMPWWVLCKHLAHADTSSNTLCYTAFLLRFQTELSRRWAETWGQTFLPHVLLRIGACIEDIELHFKDIDEDKSSKLSYQEFYLFLTRRTRCNLGPLHAFYIIQSIDTNSDGFISLKEFKETFRIRYEALKSNPEHNNEFFRVWEARAVDPSAYLQFMDEFRSIEDDRAEAASPQGKASSKKSKKSKKEKKRVKGVSVREFVNLGVDVLGGSKSTWKNTGKLLLKDAGADPDGGVRLKYLQRRVKKLTAQYDEVETVAKWIRNISSSKMSVRAIFQAMDSAGTGRLAWKQFLAGFKVLCLPEDTISSLWECVDLNGDGYVTLDEFTGCLEVRDYSRPTDHPLGPCHRSRPKWRAEPRARPPSSGEDEASPQRSEKKRKKEKKKKRAEESEAESPNPKEKKSKKEKKEKRRMHEHNGVDSDPDIRYE